MQKALKQNIKRKKKKKTMNIFRIYDNNSNEKSQSASIMAHFLDFVVDLVPLRYFFSADFV